MKTQTEIGSFAGKPLLIIYEEVEGERKEKHLLSFGLKKAEAILASIKEIEEFVKLNS